MAQIIKFAVLIIFSLNLGEHLSAATTKCKTPDDNTYEVGSILVRNCKNYVCKGPKWAVKSTCCRYHKRKVEIGSIIDTVVAEDGCTTTTLNCVANFDRPMIDIQIKNECPKPASEESLKMYMDEIKELLEQHANETAAATTAAPATTASAPSCDSGWNLVQGNCYSVQTLNLPWEAARNSCIDLGGDLASINTVAVQAQLFELQNEADFWIGANDIISDTTFTWINGDEWIYDNWNTNQPNHLDGQDCVKMKKNTGRWDDVSCDVSFMFACQKVAVGTFSFSGGNQQSSVGFQ